MPLTLEQKIGQMLWYGWQAPTPAEALTLSSHARALLEEFQVGGVILMGRNVRDARQAAGLTSELQRGAETPLLVGIDQEGGSVARLPLAGLTFPGNMALGALGEAETTSAVTRAIGEQLCVMGFNVDFAPVLDVNNNPANPVIGVRSFGEDPVKVAAMGVAALRGFGQARMIACGKHFPGHGDTAVDSHLDLPVQSASRERLDEVELAPFREAVAAGLPMVMSAHIRFTALDERWPATLSRPILTDLLRNEMGFRGVIVTDCLEMDGIARHFGVEEAALAAVEAGADCLLACHTLETQRRIHRALLEAVRGGRLPEARIEASVERILALKSAYGLEARRAADPDAAEQIVGAAPYRELERDVARAATTIVRDDHGWLPLPPGPVVVAGAERITGRVAAALREAGLDARDAMVSGPVAVSKGTLVLAVLAGAPADEQEQARCWLEEGRRVVVVALREPYPLAAYSSFPCQVAIYGSQDCNLAALGDVLAGRVRGRGTLPVTVV
jgi:beta-N-acetylhexosaminidase